MSNRDSHNIGPPSVPGEGSLGDQTPHSVNGIQGSRVDARLPHVCRPGRDRQGKSSSGDQSSLGDQVFRNPIPSALRFQQTSNLESPISNRHQTYGAAQCRRQVEPGGSGPPSVPGEGKMQQSILASQIGE